MTTMIAGTRALPRALQRVDPMRMDEGADGFHRSWIMLFPEGTFHHPQYGKLNFTRAKLSEIKANFDNRVRHIDIALDVDHKGGGEDSRATGWIEALDLREGMLGLSDGAGLWGCIKWTPYGQRLLADEEYRYFSPEFGPWTDPETGAEYDNVLIGGGLTNRPFLKVMPAVKLSEISTRAWSSVDKASLPDSAFLDSANRRLPIYEGTGPMVNGRYTKRGKLNIHGLSAALAAVHGAHTGKAMSGLPAGTEERIRRLMAKHGGSGGSGGGGGDAASKAASEGESDTMARFKTVDGAVVFSDGQLEYTSMAASGSGDAGAVMLAAKKAKPKLTPPEDDDTEQGDETIDAAEPTDEADQTYDDTGDEELDELAEEDDADGEPDGVENPVDKAPGKKASAPGKGKKMAESFESLTLSEAQAEIARLRQQNEVLAERAYEHEVNQRLASLKRSTFMLLDEAGEESGTRFALSRKFSKLYKDFLQKSSAGLTLSEGQRNGMDELLKVALSTAAIVPLGAPGMPSREWSAGAGEIGERTEKASNKQRGPQQIVRLGEEQERVVRSDYGTSLDELRFRAQRGDHDAAVKMEAAVKKAARNIDYKGL